MKEQSVLVCFKNVPPSHCIGSRGVYDCVVAPIVFESVFKDCTKKFIPLESLLEPGSVYGASALAQDLSRLQLPNGTPITTSCTYKGYELWWMHYSDIFLYSCLPYTQYKRLLALLKDFHTVYLHEPPYRHLFSLYLEAHSRTLHILRTPETRGSNRIPFGIVVQVALTALSLPVALVLRRSVLVFTGDKFDGLHDYDARMRFVYEELRKRNVPFIEFVRSLEPWNTVILHALRRRRPVVYSVALAFLGQLLGVA